MNSWNQIAVRVAQELNDGDIIDLDTGLPSEIIDYLSPYRVKERNFADVAILSASEIDEKGNVSGINETMGLVEIVEKVNKIIIVMRHLSADGNPRILKECTLPVNAKIKANLIITDMAVIKVTPRGLLLKELASGVNWHQVQKATEALLILDEGIFLGGTIGE